MRDYNVFYKDFSKKSITLLVISLYVCLLSITSVTRIVASPYINLHLTSYPNINIEHVKKHVASLSNVGSRVPGYPGNVLALSLIHI